MDLLTQTTAEIRNSLSNLKASGEDETFELAVARLSTIKPQTKFTEADIDRLFREAPSGKATKTSFETGLLVSRLFMVLSKDEWKRSFDKICRQAPIHRVAE